MLMRFKVAQVVQAHLKDHDPSVANVVKINGTLVRVGVARAALGVIAVPVDTEAWHSTHARIKKWISCQA